MNALWEFQGVIKCVGIQLAVTSVIVIVVINYMLIHSHVKVHTCSYIVYAHCTHLL